MARIRSPRAGSEGCFDDVQTQLAIIFCVRILARNLIDVVVPSLVILRRERREQDLGDEYENPTDTGAMRKRQTSPTEEQFRKEHYHHLFGTFNDYSEIVIQFGSRPTERIIPQTTSRRRRG